MSNEWLGRVLLVTGKEEFLRERAVGDVKGSVKAFDAEAEYTETTGEQVGAGDVQQMTGPSLFSSTRCVVVRSLENLHDDSVAGLVGYCSDPDPDVALVLVHSGGQKGSGVLTKLRKLPRVTEDKTGEIKAWDLPQFVNGEARRLGARIGADGAAALVQSIGQDLRGLAAAVSQLASDFPDVPITEAIVRDYFGGRGDEKTFAVADAALSGNYRLAVEELRWILDAGVAPAKITAAFAMTVRSLARYMGAASSGMGEGDVARAAGVPPWKVKTLRGQASGWTDQTVGEAVRAVAEADAGVKGREANTQHTLERLVVTLVRLRATATGRPR